MRILVAGSTGAVGRLLVPKLVRAGHEVVGMTHRPAQRSLIQSMGAHPVVVDAFDGAAVLSAVDEVRPDAVIHQLTALAERDFAANTRIRVEGTRHLVDAAQACGVTRMIAQSIAWAYAPGDGVATEDVALDVAAPLPRRRLIDGIVALENTVSEIPRHVILRYGLFYGPGTWYAADGLVADEVRNGQIAATAGMTSFVHVEDAASAAVLALDWPPGPVNIVDDDPASGAEWVPVYAASVGAPMPGVEPVGHAWERGASNAKARALGWQPMYRTWRTGFCAVRP